TVLFPSARIGLILAGTFAFVLSFGDYISPALLGGSRPPTLSILLTDQVKSGNHGPRAAVVAVTMILTLLTVVLGMLALAYRKKAAAASILPSPVPTCGCTAMSAPSSPSSSRPSSQPSCSPSPSTAIRACPWGA